MERPRNLKAWAKKGVSMAHRNFDVDNVDRQLGVGEVHWHRAVPRSGGQTS